MRARPSRYRIGGSRLNEPDLTPPADEFLVLDADASQSYTINAAVKGGDLVVNGPPGTGKSQTIANLIATLAARGQRVLFVAEKRAAIDAVLDRLRKVGLADLVLDVHEGSGSKRALAQTLARSLADAGSVPLPDLSAVQDTLERRRRDLVAHNEALHGKRHPWHLSVYEVRAALLGLGPDVATDERLRPEALGRLDGAAMADARADLRDYVSRGGLAIRAGDSPWGPALVASSVTSADQAQAALDAVRQLLQHTLPAALDRLGLLADATGIPAASSVDGWTSHLVLLRGVSATLERFDVALFEENLEVTVAALAPAARGGVARFFARLSNSEYRKARKAARSHALVKLKAKALLEAVTAAAGQRGRLRTFGAMPTAPEDLDGCEATYAQLRAELGVVAAAAGLPSLGELTPGDLATHLSGLASDQATLFKLPELQRLRTAMVGRGLGRLVEEAEKRNLTAAQATGALEYMWLSSIHEALSLADPRVGAFDGEAHSESVAEFRTADRTHIDTAPARVRRAVAERVTAARDEFREESDVVNHQAGLKRKHRPTRELFQMAPHVLGALKPCWAMSPLVVSQLLPPQQCFDVVVFDEASQVTPADAVGALMRAERAVVAGDPKQLPPTSFFAVTSGGGDDDEAHAEELEGPTALTKDFESVLDVMTSLLPPPRGTRTLGWHYRSKDERLIAFSNAQPMLYDWSLTTFPGVSGADCLEHVLGPFVQGRVGQEESVADEVAKVVELVRAHARLRPDESLGIIAMGIKHANRISEALRNARPEDSALDALMNEAAKEPVFVKNLERVQGDERDAIILSVGYGKSAEGRLLHRFGPINNEGGERRLNVAITRARARMTVVSSFSSDDMDPNKLRAEGAKMLCRYLQYAESRGADLGNVAKDKPDLNPFERDVRDRLTEVGIPLVAQFGCSGYWIDYAAQHPTKPGRMVLAIECDGATYHSSQTARDRDRLRQDHLERLGWHFHRIWSGEWFHHREREIERAVAAYQAAVARTDSAPISRGDSDPTLEPAMAAPASTRPDRDGPQPVSPGYGINEYSERELVRLIDWIESDTLLRTEDQLLGEAIRALGFQKRGSRIVAALTAAIAVSRRKRAAAEPAPAPPRARLRRDR